MVQPVETVLERRRSFARRDLDVIDEDTETLARPVAGVRDRHLGLLARECGQVDRPLLPATGVARDGVPGTGGACRQTRRGAVLGLVVIEDWVERPPAAGVLGLAALAGGLARMAVRIRQCGPVVLAHGMRLDEQVVPIELGVVRRPEGHRRATGGHVDRVRQALERDIRDVRIRVEVTRVRRERPTRSVVVRGDLGRELRVVGCRQQAAGRQEGRRDRLVLSAVGAVEGEGDAVERGSLAVDRERIAVLVEPGAVVQHRRAEPVLEHVVDPVARSGQGSAQRLHRRVSVALGVGEWVIELGTEGR